MDLILWQYTDNDFTMPNQIRSNPNVWFKKSYTLYVASRFFLNHPRFVHKPVSIFIKKTLFRLDFPRERLFPLPNLASVPIHGVLVEDNPNKIPAKYHYLVGWDNCFKAIDDARNLCEKSNVGFVLVCRSENPKAIEYFTNKKILFYNTYFALDNYIKKNNLRQEALQVSKEDSHPNGIGHAVQGEAIFQFLVEKGLIER